MQDKTFSNWGKLVLFVAMDREYLYLFSLERKCNQSIYTLSTYRVM